MSLRLRSAVALLFGLASVLAAQAQTAAPPRDARNASFWQRVDNPPPDPLQPPMSWYAPLAPLLGAPGPFLLSAKPGSESIKAQVLDEAAQFVQGSNGQALIVVHKGVVQLERYFGEAAADKPFSSPAARKAANCFSIQGAICSGGANGVGPRPVV